MRTMTESTNYVFRQPALPRRAVIPRTQTANLTNTPTQYTIWPVSWHTCAVKQLKWTTIDPCLNHDLPIFKLPSTHLEDAQKAHKMMRNIGCNSIELQLFHPEIYGRNVQSEKADAHFKSTPLSLQVSSIPKRDWPTDV